jgi:hypothetical protein
MAKVITVRVRFYSPEEVGKVMLFPDMLSKGIYRPHLVVGDPYQKTTNLDFDNKSTDEYLGVEFISQSTSLVPDKDIIAEARLIYSGVDYSALTKNVTFTIREGGKIVGNGVVIDGGL